MDYDNTNSGILFKNDFKTSDSHPDYKGNFTDTNGEEKDLAGWIRKTKNGKMMLSIKVSDKWQKEEQPFNDPIPSEEVPF